MLADHNTDVSRFSLAGDCAPSIESIQVLIAIAGVLVEGGSAASLAGVDHERQWISVLLADMIHLRPERQRSVPSQIDGGAAQRSMGQYVCRAVDTRSRPEVKPAPRGEIDVAGIH